MTDYTVETNFQNKDEFTAHLIEVKKKHGVKPDEKFNMDDPSVVHDLFDFKFNLGHGVTIY